MNRRITVLCDNTVGAVSGTLGEHGFAALVECGDEMILFDTGQGDTLLHNARRMNRDLARVRLVALSHGHYDHTGGLESLLDAVGGREVLGHPGIFSRRYRLKDTGESISIGIPCERAYLEEKGAVFNLSEEFREITPGIFLTGSVPRETPFEQGDAGLSCDCCSCVPDAIPDDQSLVIRGAKGLVILLGCCHAGVINTIEHARRMTGVEEVRWLIGGTHLGFSSEQQLGETVKGLKKYGGIRIAAGHCTGFAACARLHREFPGRFHPAHVGYTLEIPA